MSVAARALLVVSEIALAVVLLCGAGLFARALLSLQRTELGFVTRNVLTLRLSLPRATYNSARAVTFVDALVARARAMSGVSQAAAMAWTPIVDGGGNWSVLSDAMVPTTIGQSPTAAPQQVTPGFFSTLSIPFLRGRDFTDADHATAPLVVIINETLARSLWGAASPIGRRLSLSNTPTQWATVIGEVRDTRVDGVTEPAPPIMYFPHTQAQRSGYFTAVNMTLLIQNAASPAALLPAVKTAVRELDANVPVSDERSMAEIVGSSIARHRFTTLLLVGFALLALLLASVGMYGVIAYGVSQRRYEFGVRAALGATRGRVLGLVLREGLLLVSAGLALGLAGAFATGRLLRAMLGDISALDVQTVGAAALCLLTAALLALLVPARNAMAVSPTEMLRNG
ncbi:MAG: ABC transporter permease [Longimicrobiales bacterium]